MTSPTSPMLEKIKAAIKATGVLEYTDDDTLDQIGRAVLESLLQPDEGTVEAMEKAWRDSWDRSVTIAEVQTDCFTAAINNILKGGEHGQE